MADRKTHDSNATTPAQSPQTRNQRWQKRFLDHLAETSNVSEAAKHARIHSSKAYRLRREDPDFARAWLSALWEGYIHLEMEVLGRLRAGDNTADGGSKFDFTNAIRLLAAHRDNAAKAMANQRNVSAAEVRDSIDRKIEEIRRRLQHEKRLAPDA
jgi:hypothetical protein